MLAYFPAIYPDELLYSVLARCSRHLGSPPQASLLNALFGYRSVIPSLELPGYLQALANRLPPERGLSVDRMIDTLTLFPYFTAFLPPPTQAFARLSMQQGKVENLHLRLGLTGSHIGRVNTLRFCHSCLAQMETDFGELYWRRDHQLPGVLVCPEHGTVLRESTLCLSQHGRHEFVAASAENCGISSSPLVSAADSEVSPTLLELARRSADLLGHPPEARTYAGWSAYYRERMRETGLTHNLGTVDQQGLEAAFRHYYGRTLELLPHVLEGSELVGHWLEGVVRKHRKSIPPLYHLLVQQFLDQRRSILSPFGSGPWPCLNPLAHHVDDAPIKQISQHANHQNTVGVFACTCGYTYTRCFFTATKVLGPPRFLRYGPLLNTALPKLLATGITLRALARRLHLDPKTVLKLARELGVRVPWSGKPSGPARPKEPGVQKKQPDWTRSSTKLRPRRSPSRPTGQPRIDWAKIDQAWLNKLEGIIQALRTELPPVRLTRAALERRAGSPGWLGKRKHRLPRTFMLIAEVTESIEAFQLRRIHWVIGELALTTPSIQPWQVMRKAGLHSDSLPLIQSLLEE